MSEYRQDFCLFRRTDGTKRNTQPTSKPQGLQSLRTNFSRHFSLIRFRLGQAKSLSEIYFSLVCETSLMSHPLPSRCPSNISSTQASKSKSTFMLFMIYPSGVLIFAYRGFDWLISSGFGHFVTVSVRCLGGCQEKSADQSKSSSGRGKLRYFSGRAKIRTPLPTDENFAQA